MLTRRAIFSKSSVLVVLAFSAAPALAHTKLDKATPADGTTLDVTPPLIRLEFNEPIEPSLSSVRIIGPVGAPVTSDKPTSDRADERSIVVHLPKVSSGNYRVQWATVGRDGHRVKGELRFTVK